MSFYSRRMRGLSTVHTIADPKVVGTRNALTFSVDASDVKKIGKIFAAVSADTRNTIMRQALNHTGDIAFTRIARAIASEGGLKFAAAKRHMRRVRAGGGSKMNSKVWFGKGGTLVYIVEARGERIKVSSGNFKKVAWNRKWSGAKWNSKTDAGSFMIPHGGASRVTKGVVVERKGKARLPLETKYETGPAILMGKVGSDRIAVEVLQAKFMPRVMREINRRLGRAADLKTFSR